MSDGIRTASVPSQTSFATTPYFDMPISLDDFIEADLHIGPDGIDRLFGVDDIEEIRPMIHDRMIGVSDHRLKRDALGFDLVFQDAGTLGENGRIPIQEDNLVRLRKSQPF